MVMLVAQKMK